MRIGQLADEIGRRLHRVAGLGQVLTGLEDMYLAKQLEANGEKIAYVADASVFHIHDETWPQVMHRYEREAYALHQIMPQVHFTLGDFLRYFISGVLADTAVALGEQVVQNSGGFIY